MTGRLNSKISVTGTSCWSCQQLRLIFSSKTYRIFNQTTHARPQHSIVFIHNISLYFNYISSVKYVFKWSCHGHVMPFPAIWPKRFNAPNQKIEYAYFERWEKCLRVVRNASLFCPFQILKLQLVVVMRHIRKKVFHMFYHVPIFLNNSKAKLVVTVS